MSIETSLANEQKTGIHRNLVTYRMLSVFLTGCHTSSLKLWLRIPSSAYLPKKFSPLSFNNKRAKLPVVGFCFYCVEQGNFFPQNFRLSPKKARMSYHYIFGLSHGRRLHDRLGIDLLHTYLMEFLGLLELFYFVPCLISFRIRWILV